MSMTVFMHGKLGAFHAQSSDYVFCCENLLGEKIEEMLTNYVQIVKREKNISAFRCGISHFSKSPSRFNQAYVCHVNIVRNATNLLNQLNGV